MSPLAKVRAAAFELSEADRLALAHELLDGLEPLPEMPGEVVDEATAMRAWGAEAQRRLAEHDPSTDIPAEEFIAGLRADLAEQRARRSR